MTLTYKVDENVFSQAHVEEFDKVCLWLGANVMVYQIFNRIDSINKFT